MKKAVRFLSYILVAALASAVTLFAVCGQPKYSKLEELADLIEERFIGEADRTAMEDAAAEAMVASLGDQWSYYIPASEYASHLEQVNNAYVGVGITISVREDETGFDILQVSEGGPAETVGIRAGDIVVGVEGQSVAGMSVNDVSNLVRGEEGTEVLLTIRRGSEELEFRVTRMTLQTVVASSQMLEGNIGLVTIVNFDARCAEETIAAVEALLEQDAKALIFDVRNNPGGYKDELVKVLDYLLPEGPLFHSEDYLGRVLVDESDAACLELPMAVLVNGNSYSAAEFFAAALREYGWATVIGEQTCGKGYFQTTIELSDGSAVGLSVGKYTTPNGVSLAEEGGLTPDLTVDVDEETAWNIYAGNLDAAEDPQIQAAVDALNP